MPKKEKQHDEHTRQIWLKPKILGLEDIVLSTREVSMFRGKHQRLYHQPDNVAFDYINRRIYNIEYKCNLNGVKKGKKQLRETAAVLRDMFPQYRVINLLVHGNYKIQEIK